MTTTGPPVDAGWLAALVEQGLPVLLQVKKGDLDRLRVSAQAFRQPDEERGDVASVGLDCVFAAVGAPQMLGEQIQVVAHECALAWQRFMRWVLSRFSSPKSTINGAK